MTKIRECRFGDPLTWKTSSVVDTYPKPMVVFNCQPGGMDSVHVPYQRMTSNEFRTMILKKSLVTDGSVILLDYATGRPNKISLTAFRAAEAGPTQDFFQDMNCLYDFNPFQTAVVDPFSRFADLILEFQLAINTRNNKKIERPDQDIWGLTSSKCSELISSIYGLDCNTVIITHCHTEQDGLTQQITTMPDSIGKSRALLSQLAASTVYAYIEIGPNGKPQGKLTTVPKNTVRWAGVRTTNHDRPQVCGPTFQELYGEK